MTRFTHYLVSLMFISSLLGCSTDRLPFVYKVPVEQGNILSEEALAQLSEGMSKKTVKSLLGDPLLNLHGRENRWDYVYSLQKGQTVVDNKRLVVFFKHNKVARFEFIEPHREQDNTA